VQEAKSNSADWAQPGHAAWDMPAKVEISGQGYGYAPGLEQSWQNANANGWGHKQELEQLQMQMEALKSQQKHETALLEKLLGSKTQKIQPSMNSPGVDFSQVLQNAQPSPAQPSAQWVTAVMSIAPLLSSEGMHRALAILDKATENAQQVKTLEKIINAAEEGKGSSSSPLPFFQQTAEQMRASFQSYQHELLSTLERLPLEFPAQPNHDWHQGQLSGLRSQHNPEAEQLKDDFRRLQDAMDVLDSNGSGTAKLGMALQRALLSAPSAAAAAPQDLAEFERSLGLGNRANGFAANGFHRMESEPAAPGLGFGLGEHFNRTVTAPAGLAPPSAYPLDLLAAGLTNPQVAALMGNLQPDYLSGHAAQPKGLPAQQRQPRNPSKGNGNMQYPLPGNMQYPSPQHQPLTMPQKQVQTLSTSLQVLSTESPDRLFIVRRINKLGFKATRILKRHYGAFGTVVKVLVAHSTVRQCGETHVQARRRPSSLGFVQMTTSDAVSQILSLGDDQEVDGVIIRVQRFERQHGDAIQEEEEEEAEMANDSDECWTRHRSSQSQASTCTGTSASSGGGIRTADLPSMPKKAVKAYSMKTSSSSSNASSRSGRSAIEPIPEHRQSEVTL